MTNSEAISILKAELSCIKMSRNSGATATQEAFDKAIDALLTLDKINNYGCVTCSISKEYDCKGCAYEDVEDWKDPCRICRRNQKDYYRKAAKDED